MREKDWVNNFLLFIAMAGSFIGGMVTKPAGTIGVIVVTGLGWWAFDKMLNH